MARRKSWYLVLAIALIGATLPGQVRAEACEACDFVQQLGDQAVEVLHSPSVSPEMRDSAFRDLLRENFDIRRIGAYVLGPYWDEANEQERRDYLNAFSEYVVKTYSAVLTDYSGEGLKVTSEKRLAKSYTIVRTRIDEPGGKSVGADWYVRSGKGELKIFDVKVDGISLATTQRSQLMSVMRRKGFDGLIKVLQARAQ